MNLMKYFLFACLAIVTAQTQAMLIKASDFAVGTEINQLDANTTISWIRGYGNTPETLPVSIQEAQSFHGGANSFIGATHDIWGLASSPSLITSLDDIYASQRWFSGMLIAYTAPTRQLSLNGFDPYGDGFKALTFDKNGNFLNWQHGYTSRQSEERCFELDNNGYREQRCGTAFGGTLHFDSDVSYILLGGSDSSLYIESLDASLPEPSILLLLLIGGLGVALSRRHHINIAS